VEYPVPPGVPGGKQFAALIRAILDKNAALRTSAAEVARALEILEASDVRGLLGRWPPSPLSGYRYN
jgi:hypothetical protein